MDPRLLDYYNRELQYLREMGGEFAEEYPKIAQRLSLDGFECADPYVERLLEGFAFLAARVQLKIDAEFPRFTRHLLEMVYPHYLGPTPSMAVVQFEPDLTEGALAEGFEIPRHSNLRSTLGPGDDTPCVYLTAHDVTLWPVEIVSAEYFNSSIEIATFEPQAQKKAKAGLKLKLRSTAGLKFNELNLDSLTFFLRGSGEIAMHTYEQLLARCLRMVVRPATRNPPWQVTIDGSEVKRVGYDDDQAMLPYGPRSFQGYRLLHEYFAFPERYMFVRAGGLRQAVKRDDARELELVFLFDDSDPVLENTVEASHFALNCTPAVNLFPKRADRIHLSERHHEYHVVADRTRPMDFEIFSVEGVVGHGTHAEVEQDFLPFYAYNDLSRHRDHRAFYSVRRQPRLLSSRQRRLGPRSSYVGGEIFVSLVDANCAPFSTDLRQLSVSCLCTNRDLPLHMSVGQGDTDFDLQASAPVESVRCVAGPTKPRASHAEGESAWRLISHLSLNYLSVIDNDEQQGAAALRELLSLYGGVSDATHRKQVEGILSVTSRPINRWIRSQGPAALGRGLEVTMKFDEGAFAGSGIFLLGAVLERFFAKYVSTNSFTETVVTEAERGEIIRWPMTIGRRQRL